MSSLVFSIQLFPTPPPLVGAHSEAASQLPCHASSRPPGHACEWVPARGGGTEKCQKPVHPKNELARNNEPLVCAHLELLFHWKVWCIGFCRPLSYSGHMSWEDLGRGRAGSEMLIGTLVVC